MRRIEATRKVIVRHREHLFAKEITSFEQLSQLEENAEIAIMNHCEMVIGRIISKEKEWIFIDAVTNTVTVRRDSFKYGNFMYELL
ncbi:hypothetical protein ACFVS2_25585 [Brevibacillus sp. NPDC058079]|uniref:hypothetical protein n=1 Tax=Brevibacillus sp. NPDC058079 TaxID=3346330 RepID=UPI0036E96150